MGGGAGVAVSTGPAAGAALSAGAAGTLCFGAVGATARVPPVVAGFFLAAFFGWRVTISISSVSTMRMWLVRLRMALELPRARDFMRFIVGPSPTVASLTTSVSTRSSLLFSALAMALLSVLPTSPAAFLGLNAIRSSAAEAGNP